MPPKSKPTQSAANRGVSAARGARGTRGGRGGGRGGHATTTTSAASQPDQEEVSISLAEVEAMKAELEKLRKASNAEAKKAAEAKRKIGESFLNFPNHTNFPPESRKRTADRLSQEMEEEEEEEDSTERASSSKRLRTNSLFLYDDLDEDEQALAKSLPPVSTSRPSTSGPVRRSNIISSDDDIQEQQGECSFWS
jgi:hypothetical protein